VLLELDGAQILSPSDFLQNVYAHQRHQVDTVKIPSTSTSKETS